MEATESLCFMLAEWFQCHSIHLSYKVLNHIRGYDTPMTPATDKELVNLMKPFTFVKNFLQG